jgi:hypothetical protein
MGCAGEESQRKKKTKKSRYIKTYITVLFYRHRQGGPPTTLVRITKQRGVTSQMAVIFTITALRISKLTNLVHG